MSSLSLRVSACLLALAVVLLAPQAASATINDALGVSCSVQGDGVRFCSDTPRSTVASPVDGVPIDVNVAFPPAPPSGPDGDYPLVMMFHGYGGEKLPLAQMQPWLDRGYATFSMTDRGFHESCGSPASQAAAPPGECADGYVRLIDNRYEVRDAQDFAGLLADEGLIDGQRIGSIGGSYGGGMSMALAALKNRVVNLDYSLSPWTSPMGKPMRIAAAAPIVPWTDLAYSLAPNGSTLDYVADAPYRGRPGVEKASFVSGLYLSGLGAPGYYATPGTDPHADLTAWRNRINAGEPYGQDVEDILAEFQRHSSYYIDHSIPPAPLLMSSGFTDDIFPADETIRFYNRTRTQYPDADVALMFGDFGHQRGANKPDFIAALGKRQFEWFAHFLEGEGAKPQEGVEAWTQTCPSDAPSGGPYKADSWATIAPGEVRFEDGGTKTIAPDSTTGGDFNPITNSNACATISGDDEAGSAAYRMDAAPAGGYTMLGSATVIADFTLPGDTSQVAARLLDVAPSGEATLVDRGLWRPATGGPTRQVFQLHPNGWHFAEGHVPKLELIAADGVRPDPGALLSYGLPSNNQQPVTVSDLELRIPVVERPGALGGLVKAPAERFLPSGYELAKDFADLDHPAAGLKGKKLKVKGRKLTATVTCPDAFVACHDGAIVVKAKLRKAGKGKGRAGSKLRTIAKGGFDEVAGGGSARVRMKLSARAVRYFRSKRKLSVKAEITVAETDAVGRANGKASGPKRKRQK